MEEYLESLPSERKKVVFIDEMPWMDSKVPILSVLWKTFGTAGLCYEEEGALSKEFDELYNAVFPVADTYISVVRLLYEHKKGLTRKEIGEKIGLNGTNLTRILSNLEKCSFIGKRTQFGNKKNEATYRLIDFYTLFYFKFIEKNLSLDISWWTHHLDSSSISAWQGLTFELICMEHHQQIKNALGISGMATSVSTWRSYPDEKKDLPGAQIDMIIDRADRMIHLWVLSHF